MSDEAANVNEGLLETLGMRIVEASAERVVLEWEAGQTHWQPMGLVHGGVYCSAVETVCSYGAFLAIQERTPGRAVVGLENSTSFIRSVRTGRLRAVGTPVTRGRTTQVWEAVILDEDERTVATGRVRLLAVGQDGRPVAQ